MITADCPAKLCDCDLVCASAVIVNIMVLHTLSLVIDIVNGICHFAKKILQIEYLLKHNWIVSALSSTAVLMTYG